MAVITPEQSTEVHEETRRDSASRKYAVELIGTFFLVFTVGTAVASGSALAPLAIGSALMGLGYARGDGSRGPYKPAPTTAGPVGGPLQPLAPAAGRVGH